MKKGDIVFGLLVPTNQNTAKAIHPAMRAFDDPATCALRGIPFELLGFFTSRSNVRGESKFHQEITNLLKIISFIQTHALRLFGRRRWTFDGNAFNSFPHQFHVISVCTGDTQPDWHAVSFGQEATFDAAFSAICGVGTAFFPPPTGLWSLHHPYSTNPSRFLSVRQSVPARVARISKRRLPLPILENACVRSNPNRAPFHPRLSTGNRCVAHRRSHPHIFGQEHVGDHRQNDAYFCELATTVEISSRVRRSHESSLSFCYSVCVHACVLA